MKIEQRRVMFDLAFPFSKLYGDPSILKSASRGSLPVVGGPIVSGTVGTTNAAGFWLDWGL